MEGPVAGNEACRALSECEEHVRIRGQEGKENDGGRSRERGWGRLIVAAHLFFLTPPSPSPLEAHRRFPPALSSPSSLLRPSPFRQAHSRQRIPLEVRPFFLDFFRFFSWYLPCIRPPSSRSRDPFRLLIYRTYYHPYSILNRLRDYLAILPSTRLLYSTHLYSPFTTSTGPRSSSSFSCFGFR